MTNKKIIGTRTEQEIIERYSKLNPKFKENLTDVYNSFLRLRMYAYGEDWQKEFARDSATRTIVSGQILYPICRGNIDEQIRNSLNSKDGKFSQLDLEHLTELESVVNFLNERGCELQADEAQEAYDLLIPLLYGKKCEEKIQRMKGGMK
ncbi:hypothetical protein HY450_00745 [Candidatus Pacearchaeota archaeon]|nr:hypothetical protein [Candidatus Pacearchaeota archaeon]